MPVYVDWHFCICNIIITMWSSDVKQ